MSRILGTALLLVWAAPAIVVAQEHEHAPSPYVGQETREIKALDADRVAGLLAGEGLGYALAAELNGLPGPKHVLELATALGLSEEQRAVTAAIFEAMREAAVELGRRIVAAERTLDRGFAEGVADADAVRARASKSGDWKASSGRFTWRRTWR